MLHRCHCFLLHLTGRTGKSKKKLTQNINIEISSIPIFTDLDVDWPAADMVEWKNWVLLDVVESSFISTLKHKYLTIRGVKT